MLAFDHLCTGKSMGLAEARLSLRQREILVAAGRLAKEKSRSRGVFLSAYQCTRTPPPPSSPSCMKALLVGKC